jgi:hypothetical protein
MTYRSCRVCWLFAVLVLAMVSCGDDGGGDEESACGGEGAGCDDGDACTVNERCTGGRCVGEPLDCSSLDDVCVVGVCDPDEGCVTENAPDGTGCDDGMSCTTEDVCTGGTCDGTPVDCAVAEDDCNVAECSEAEDGACVRTPGANDVNCTTNCTEGGMCNGGTCSGGTPLDGEPEGPDGDETCSDYLDNDCDELFDDDDPDCQ